MQFLTRHLTAPRPGTAKAAWRFGRCLMGVMTVLFLPGNAFGNGFGKVNLAWNRNPEANVAGYELRYRTGNNTRSAIVNVGANTRWTLSGLAPNTTYFIAIRAYNRAGLRSPYTAEITHATPPVRVNRAPDTRILAPNTGGTVVTGHPVLFSATATDPDGGKPSIRWNFGSGSGLSDITSPTAGVRFGVPGVYRVTATAIDGAGLADPTPASRVITVIPAWANTSRGGWTLRHVNSEEAVGYAATRAFDGNPKTFWHTSWISSSTPPPHHIELDLGSARHIKGFRYLPRQDGFKVGAIGRYAFYVSADGTNWGNPTATGAFDGNSTEKTVVGSSKYGRYIRLVSLTEAYGNLHCSIAELNVLSGPPPNRRPTAASRVVSTPKNKKISLTPRASDPDGNPLTCRILKQPAKGKLTGTFPNFVYRPRVGFTGSDMFTFRVHDGLLTSTVAKIRIQVKAPKKAKRKALSANSRTASKAGKAAVGKTSGSLTKGGAAARPVRETVNINGTGYLTLTIPKPASGKGKKPVVEVSSDLVKWFSGKRHTTVLADNKRVLRVRDNTPLHPGRKRFIRVSPATR